MKKGKIIALALAGAITFMGAGYAAWQDNVTIKSEVSTGNINVVFEDYKEGYCPINWMENYADLEDRYNVAKLEDDGHIIPDPVTKEAGKVLTVGVSNLYPSEKYCMGEDRPALFISSSIKNKGTIPVKFDNVEIKATDEATKVLFDDIKVEFSTICVVDTVKDHYKIWVQTGKRWWQGHFEDVDTQYDLERRLAGTHYDMSLTEFESWLNTVLKDKELNPNEILAFAQYDEKLTTVIGPMFQLYLDKESGRETQGIDGKINFKFNWKAFNK